MAINPFRKVQAHLNESKTRETATRVAANVPEVIDGPYALIGAVLRLLHDAVEVHLHGLDEVVLAHGRGGATGANPVPCPISD